VFVVYPLSVERHVLIKKFSTGGLVMAMLASQSLFAYQPEKSFWAERRRVARQNPSAM
jgi:hypothetical protein